MAELLSAGDIVAQVRKRFGIRGDASLGLESTIVPVTNIADLEGPPFNSKRGGTFGLASGPVAAQFSYVGIRVNFPPDGSKNFRAVVRRVWAAAPAAGAIITGLKLANSAALDAAIGAPALNVIAGSWDSNTDDTVARTQVVSYQATSVTAFGQDGIVFVVPGNSTTYSVEGPWCIAPGNTLFLQAQTVNLALIGSFYWDEYYVG